ncbi:unnamed protein product (macronuclear) [Paramecium tetraurelia]|uniref:Uncharacterized protein n=1 Tax=Paramecium tetraurelia TaxID=5888 RepID=A0BLG9_PARTE|nr:uncharacterized protein GSPATT00030019001 [Paramecium tetraurelia]CAK59386.1 unnamed protein product [Paramecium tetraurelia]|eukprot:XP_001426784.1 hypothetical protein (macronuclear) [Paramecium tetraurelia strain d4-2]
MIVFCANSLPQVIANQGLRQFQVILQSLKPQLILNQCGGDIETRAQYFKKHLSKFNEPFHLIGYGIAGLDLRYVLSQNGDIRAKSLITIGTPHRGSILSDLYRRRRIEDDVIEPICRVLGVRYNFFEEINSENIRDFNLVATNQEAIKYFSLNAETEVGQMSQIYQASGTIIESEKEYPVESGSDGVFAHNETKWGQHVATLDCDHGAMIGIPNQRNGEQTVDIIQQLIQDL